jgi:hypothetical protein
MFEYVVVTPLGDIVYRDRHGNPLTKDTAKLFAEAVNNAYKPEFATAQVFRLVPVE